MNTPMDHAVVLGAGIAGLTAARVLADRYAQVTVVDRDQLPDTPEPRAGVPQGHHGHVLLLAGQRAIEGLFPGVLDELTTAGAVRFDLGEDLIFYRLGLVWTRFNIGFELVSATRPLLESVLRRRVRALPTVTVRAGTAASGLVSSGETVTGVRLDDGTALTADLIVDATGRSSRSDRWLAAMGLPTPAVSEVKAGVRYASRFVRRDPSDLGGAAGMFLLPTPPAEKRAGLVLRVEGDRWLVSMGGWHGQAPGADEHDFMAHARTLPLPDIADLMERAEPLTDIAAYQFPSSRHRHFERLRRLPAGYVALGDSVCSFNPIYGQGMTCAALAAVALGDSLDRHGHASAAMAADYYRRTGDLIKVPWRFAVGGDFLYPETVGTRARGVGLLNRYSLKIQQAAQVSPEIRRVFTSVQHLLAPPEVLSKPGMVLKVLRAARSAPAPVSGHPSGPASRGR